MENKVYYGEYSLKHWIELILKRDIILPDYQRHFVWNEEKVKILIKTFSDKQFVPPVTIGAFKINDKNRNLILDGQQRLTSILLAYLGLYPNKGKNINSLESYANENDDDDEKEEQDLYIYEWTFKELTKKGNNKSDLIKNINNKEYKSINFDLKDDFFEKNFLGFSYLVPNISNNEKVQQKYYSSVFRNINIHGQKLLPQESRASLYFLDKGLTKFFIPDFCQKITVKQVNNNGKFDFVRHLSLLSQYHKDKNTNSIARGYKSKMEQYYEDYIYSVVDDNSTLFGRFSKIFPNKEYSSYFETLRQTINNLNIPKVYNSIIELDVYFFGLMYQIIFNKKEICIINNTKVNFKDKKSIKSIEIEDFKQKLDDQINKFKNDKSHSKTPGSLKFLRSRIKESIELYEKLVNKNE